MAYSTCGGKPQWPHQETRTCDECDKCPACERFSEVHLWCWKCCGKLIGCPECAPKLAAHVVEQGPPNEDFQMAEVLAGYRAALSITRPQTPRSREQVLQRYPILVSHMICSSLGYFTPQAADGALLSYLEGRVNYCEWYFHRSGGNREKILEVGRRVVEDSFRFRRSHTGMMASYRQARMLVEQVRGGGEGPIFASWF